jgi:hypothetical protein
MNSSTSRLAKARRQTHHAPRRAPRTNGRALLIIAALLATGALASQLAAQSESKLYYTPCGGGFIEVCGEETSYSGCGWSFKGYHLPVFPFVGVIPWYGCETETTKVLYKDYFRSAGDLQEV